MSSIGTDGSSESSSPVPSSSGKDSHNGERHTPTGGQAGSSGTGGQSGSGPVTAKRQQRLEKNR
jgi:hypothetical protein